MNSRSGACLNSPVFRSSPRQDRLELGLAHPRPREAAAALLGGAAGDEEDDIHLLTAAA